LALEPDDGAQLLSSRRPRNQPRALDGTASPALGKESRRLLPAMRLARDEAAVHPIASVGDDTEPEAEGPAGNGC
jgi:hypothetical protein